MTTENIKSAEYHADSTTETAGYALPVGIDAQPDPKTTLIDYRGLDFKEILAACPIDDIELSRNTDPPRPLDL
jgi:hypothetical protein